MSSTNGSSRPPGCVSIPVQIIRESTPTGGSGGNGGGSNSRNQSPYRTSHNDTSHTGFSDSPPWTSNSPSRFQPRHSPGPAYDRVISNSQFNQPINSSYQSYQQPQYRHPNQQMYEPGPSQFSRSSEDLLSSPFDSMRYGTQQPFSSLIPPSFGSGFRNDSDFVHSNRHPSALRRSFDALNDFPDMQTSFPTTRPYASEQQQPYYRSSYQTQAQPQPPPPQQQQPSYPNQTYINPKPVHTNEYTIPVHHYQANNFQGAGNNVSNDRSRSPNPPRGGSPARPPPTNTSQQQQEPEPKMAKDTDGPIPMPPPPSYSQSQQSQPTDQQVPSTDPSASINIPSTQAPPPPPPPPEPVRDPNTIALEKLEQIKQILDALEKEVDAFNGSSRNERAYKVLDEQALKIMIRCDELVDVSADIKEKRKEMIRNVQRVLGKLESKVPSTPATAQNSNPIETTTAANVQNSNTTDTKSVSSTTTTSTPASSTDIYEQHMQSKSTSPPKDIPNVTTSTPTATTTTTEQSISA